MKSNIFLSSLILLGCLTIFSCQKDADDLPLVEEETPETEQTETTRELEEGESILNIRLTDGPIDLQAVNIDIVGMYIIADDTRHKLSTVEGIYNLLDFQDGIDTLISVDTFSISFLQDIVFELGDNNSVIDNAGVEHPLELPSANRDFLTINFNQRLDTLQLLDIQIDFDACKSVHLTDSGRWILRPVIDIKRFNDRPMVTDSVSMGGNKIDMIKEAYPEYDIFDIERKEYCFTDNIVIRAEMRSSTSDEQQTLLLNMECDYLYIVKFQELEDIPANILQAAQDAVGVNIDLFNRVQLYASFTGAITYGLSGIDALGTAGTQINIYLNENAGVICLE